MGKSSFNKGNGWVSSSNPVYVQLSFLYTPKKKKRRTWNVPHCGKRKLFFFSHAGIQFGVPAVSFSGCDYLDDVAQWRCLHLQALPRRCILLLVYRAQSVECQVRKMNAKMDPWQESDANSINRSTAWLSSRKQISIVTTCVSCVCPRGCVPNLAHPFLRFPKNLWNEFPK